MPKSQLEKTLEKQRKESQRQAQKQADEMARRDRAKTIVEGQPIVNGFRILDANAEGLLKIILDIYDGNESNRVSGRTENIPDNYQHSLGLEFEIVVLTLT